ncbi:MAG: bifunctional phosphopantothenoylcysteine decarboxylase/phosphopantothenate--cysteine ligase CoaBC [Desulfurococcaceae archaeon]
MKKELSAGEELSSFAYQPLRGKNIILGVTGSVALYRSVDLARKLIRMGASLKVIMTRFSTKLVGPDLFHWATGNKPYIEMTGETEHIDLAKWGDALIVAPATLNTMCKIAFGVLDELLSLTAVTMLGAGKRIVVVPAMNIRLMNSPQYRRSLEILEEQGVIIIPSLIEEDKAKYPPLDDLAHCIDASVNRGRDLRVAKVIVTAGPTREYIDPVRVITNPSSGLMGVLIAREAACRGAEVTLVHGPLATEIPYMVKTVYADTTDYMAKAIESLTKEQVHEAAVFAGAPVDFRPISSSEVKIPTRSTPKLILELETTPKVIKSIIKRPRILIGFAAESQSGEELLRKGKEKMSDYSLDLVVANNILSERAGFGKEYLDAIIIDSSGVLRDGLIHKHEIARLVVDYIVSSLRKK